MNLTLADKKQVPAPVQRPYKTEVSFEVDMGHPRDPEILNVLNRMVASQDWETADLKLNRNLTLRNVVAVLECRTTVLTMSPDSLVSVTVRVLCLDIVDVTPTAEPEVVTPTLCLEGNQA